MRELQELFFLNYMLLDSLFHIILSDFKELHQNKVLKDKPNSQGTDTSLERQEGPLWGNILDLHQAGSLLFPSFSMRLNGIFTNRVGCVLSGQKCRAEGICCEQDRQHPLPEAAGTPVSIK